MSKIDAAKLLLSRLKDVRSLGAWRNNELKADRAVRMWLTYERWAQEVEVYLMCVDAEIYTQRATPDSETRQSKVKRGAK